MLVIATGAPFAQSEYVENSGDWLVQVGVSDRAMLGLEMVCAKKVSLAPDRLALHLRGGWEVPLLLSLSSRSLDAMKFRGGLGMKPVSWRALGIGGGLDVFFDTQHQTLGQLTGLGLDAGMFPGFYLKKSYWGLHMGLHYVALLHVRHSTYAKQTFTMRYPGEKGGRDGWYLRPALRLSAGVAGGGLIGNLFCLDMRTGVRFSPSRFRIVMDGMMFGQLPFYANLRFGVRI
jgi:hypothetical protein